MGWKFWNELQGRIRIDVKEKTNMKAWKQRKKRKHENFFWHGKSIPIPFFFLFTWPPKHRQKRSFCNQGNEALNLAKRKICSKWRGKFFSSFQQRKWHTTTCWEIRFLFYTSKIMIPGRLDSCLDFDNRPSRKPTPELAGSQSPIARRTMS